MRPTARFALVLAVLALAALAFACGDDGDAPPATPTSAPAEGTAAPTADLPGVLSLSSPAFADNATMPQQYTCDGDNVSPPLIIEGHPEGTESLALTVVDIDVGDGGFVHWTVFNMDPATPAVAEGTIPGAGEQGVTSRGQPGYFGPCPPSGEHRYVFTLYALDTTLALDNTATIDDITAAIEGHVLDRAQLTALYAGET